MRIVEVGSGSGGTSVVVMAALADLGERIEYVYTDISPQLIAYGRKTYGSDFPFATFRLLDVEKDVNYQVTQFSQIRRFNHSSTDLETLGLILLQCHHTVVLLDLTKDMKWLMAHRDMALGGMTSFSPPTCCMPRATWRSPSKIARRCCATAGC